MISIYHWFLKRNVSLQSTNFLLTLSHSIRIYLARWDKRFDTFKTVNERFGNI